MSVMLHRNNKEWRTVSNLFVLYSGPRKGQGASKAAIARWMKSAFEEAYSIAALQAPPKLKAHSTRALATSWAEKQGLSAQ